MDSLPEPTPAEAALERLLNQLGNGALAGEFERERVFGAWRVDFYFPAVKLAIEVDGGYHRAQSRWRKDLHKTTELEAQGITVLRVTNAEVFGDRDRLVAKLRDAWRTIGMLEWRGKKAANAVATADDSAWLYAAVEEALAMRDVDEAAVVREVRKDPLLAKLAQRLSVRKK